MDRQETMALIEEICEKVRQHKKLLTWIIVFAVALVLIALSLRYVRYLVFTYPVNQVSQYGITNTTEKANLINQYRTTSIQFIATLAQIIGGFVLLLGLYFTWENLITAREGQITERFTRAVEQLGNDKLEVRLGGIYALERIANESDKDYWQIMELLSYYIRSNSPANIDIIDNEEITNKPKKYIDREFMVSYDIRAILIVIKRRKHFFKAGEPESLELREACLRLANLSNAHLEEAYLYDSDLVGAYLEGAYLKGAHLGGARLNWAYCNEAHFEEAHLEGTHLEKTCFKGANFKGANFKGAYFEGAYLMEACLIDAKNLSVDELSKVKTLYNAKLDEGLRGSLEEKYPEKYQALIKKPDYMLQLCRKTN